MDTFSSPINDTISLTAFQKRALPVIRYSKAHFASSDDLAWRAHPSVFSRACFSTIAVSVGA